MRSRNTVINKMVKSNKEMYILLYAGMLLVNMYIQYCVFEYFKNNGSLKALFNEKSINILITFIFAINYIFVLSEIIDDHIYDLKILKICGISDKGLSLMIFFCIIKNWIYSFIVSAAILFLCSIILNQSLSCILKAFLVSFLINFVLKFYLADTSHRRNTQYFGGWI